MQDLSLAPLCACKCHKELGSDHVQHEPKGTYACKPVRYHHSPIVIVTASRILTTLSVRVIRINIRIDIRDMSTFVIS